MDDVGTIEQQIQCVITSNTSWRYYGILSKILRYQYHDLIYFSINLTKVFDNLKER